MPKLGDKWKMGPVKSDDNANIWYLYYNDARVGQLREDLKQKAFSFSIGLFDNAAATEQKLLLLRSRQNQ